MVLLGFYRFGGSGNRTKLHPKGVKIDTRWSVDPKHASWTLKKSILELILASQDLPKWNLGGLQGPENRVGRTRAESDSHSKCHSALGNGRISV